MPTVRNADPKWVERIIAQGARVGPTPRLPGLPGPHTAKLIDRAMSEKEFQALVVSVAKARNYRVYHTHDSRRSEPGFPDCIIAKRGRMIAAELKIPGNRPTPDQEEWLSLFDSVGLPNAVWYPSQWEEILEVLS